MVVNYPLSWHQQSARYSREDRTRMGIDFALPHLEDMENKFAITYLRDWGQMLYSKAAGVVGAILFYWSFHHANQSTNLPHHCCVYNWFTVLCLCAEEASGAVIDDAMSISHDRLFRAICRSLSLG